MYKSVLVGTDGSEAAGAAVTHAGNLVRATNGILHVISVVETNAKSFRFGVTEVDEINRRLGDIVEGVVDEYRESGIRVEFEIRRGKPAVEILAYAKEIDVDVIVVGQVGADHEQFAWVGSTALRLARNADRPLIVVPPTDDDRILTSSSA